MTDAGVTITLKDVLLATFHNFTEEADKRHMISGDSIEAVFSGSDSGKKIIARCISDTPGDVKKWGICCVDAAHPDAKEIAFGPTLTEAIEAFVDVIEHKNCNCKCHELKTDSPAA